MNKQEYLGTLAERLVGVPQEEIDKSIAYFSEMIDDRVEDGMSEEAAIMEVGSVDDAVKEILENVPLTSIIKTRARTRRKMRPFEIVLLIVGSPIWFPLLLCAIILIFVLYLVIWVVVLVFFIVDLVLLICGIAAVVAGILGFPYAGIKYPLLAIGAGLVLIGIALLLIVPLIKLAKVTAKLGKIIVLWIKSWFVGRKKNA